MGPIPLAFDVTDALPGEVAQGQHLLIVAWLFFPDDPAILGPRPVTMTMLSGGSYDKRYHHSVVPGRAGYSAAEHLAALGNIVLLADHLGTGESSRAPDQRLATRHVVAAANHSTVEQFHDRLACGDLHPALPAIADVVRIGGGHSMGAMQTVVQQAAHRSYDGILFMGYTTQGVHFYHGTERVRAADYLPTGAVPDYANNDRGAQHHNFYWDDVPDDVIRFDDGQAVPTPTMIGLDSIRTDIIAEDTAAIDVPVFFGNGERDVSPDPRAEAAAFARCTDFTTYVLPRSAHCQTFAGTRHLFWDRIHAWCRGVPLGGRHG